MTISLRGHRQGWLEKGRIPKHVLISGWQRVILHQLVEDLSDEITQFEPQC